MIPDRFTFSQEGPDALVEGCFLITRWRSSRVSIPVRIWFGGPPDPETGEELDRTPRWNVTVGGVPVDDQPIEVGGLIIGSLSDVWPACRSEPVSRAEHDYQVERAAWAAAWDPNDPFGSASGRIDPMTATLPFMESL